MADATEQGGEVLRGPRAKQAIESGEITREGAKQTVKQKSQEQQDKMKQQVEKEDLTPQQQEALKKLRDAKNSEERVKVFATVADDIGLDPLLSLIPELGDGGSSIVSGVYLLMEAKKADLGTGSYLKIIGLQAADFAVGAIPIAGDAADYFFKANKWSAKSFEDQTQEMIKKAREAGVSEEKIRQLTEKAEKWPQLANRAVGLYAKANPKSKEAEPQMAQATGE